MTLKEFLRQQNSGNKYHSSDVWGDTSAEDLESPLYHAEYSTRLRGRWGGFGERVDFLKHTKKSDVYLVRNEQGDIIAAFVGTTLYHIDRYSPKSIPHAIGGGRREDFKSLTVDRTVKVKYMDREVTQKLDRDFVTLKAEMPILLQRFESRGKWFEVRTNQSPEKNSGQSIYIVYVSGIRPLVVGAATREWGIASLLRVAKEWRGYGLGKVLKSFWSRINPLFVSGGFTQDGERNAVRFYYSRVREFLSRGWYSQLVKDGTLTLDRVRDILKDLPERVTFVPKAKEEEKKETGVILTYSDGSASVVLYDAAFLKDRDPVHIKASALMRGSGDKLYMYKIDWDPGYEDKISRAAVQLHLDSGGGPLWISHETYGDIWNPEKVPGAVIDGDYATFNRKVYPLRTEMRKEEVVRKRVDRYDEAYYSLLESADAKW